jgi:hypothetical protein
VRIEILDDAQEDLIEGFRFYEKREIGVGSYSLDYLFSDINSLVLERYSKAPRPVISFPTISRLMSSVPS